MASRREYEMLFRLSANSSGNFNSTFSGAKNTVLQLQNQISELNRLQGDISTYQRQQQAIENTRKKLEMYQQQLANVQKEMNGAESYSSALANKEVDLQAKIDKTGATLSSQTSTLHQMGSALESASVDVKNLSGSSEQLRAKIDALKNEEEDAAEKANRFRDSNVQAFDDIKQAIVTAGIAKALEEIFEYYMECTDASMQFETAMTGVAKTTDLTDAEFAAMSEDIKAMSENIPETTTELAAIAETAGQLGIEKSSLEDFTEIMAMLGTATNMTSDEAATMLAQFASITGMDPSFYMNLGSTIVDLGNNYATTERNIADMSQTIAAAGSIAGMTEAEILGVSAAVTSLGITSQNGGTQMAKLISDINSAVSSGEGLSDWAAAAGMTADEFAAAWGKDAAGALDMFIRGLNATYVAGGDVYGVLNDLGITETRMVTMITSLAKSGDRLTSTLGTANTAWAQNTALATEAEKRYATTQSKLILVQNAYTNLKVAIGDEYTPELQRAYEIGADLLDGFTAFVQKNPGIIKGFTAVTIAVAVFAGGLIVYTIAVKVAEAATRAFTAAMDANPIFLVITAAVALTAALISLAPELSESEKETNALVEAIKNHREEVEQMRDATESSIDGIMDSAVAAALLKDELYELANKENKTNAEKQQMRLLVDQLNALYPELKLSIDEVTGALSKNADEVGNTIAAMKLQAKAAAFMDAYTNAIKEQSEAQREYDEVSSKLMAQLEYEAALYGETTEELYNQILATGIASDTMTPLLQAYWEADATLKELNDDVGYYSGQIDDLTDAQAAEAAAADEAAQQQNAVDAAVKDTETAIDELTAAYDEVYNAAKQSVEGQYSLWDTAAKVVATSVADMNASIDSQTEYWKSYNDDLASLSGRTDEIEGLADMIASFADGTPESVNAIAGMADASDEDLAAMVTSWKALQEEQGTTADSIAELATDFSDSMDAILNDLSETITAMDMSDEATTAATETVNAYIDNLESRAADAYTAARAVAQAAANGLNGGYVGTEDVSGYASGTMSAEPGWKWVGELGPELMYMHGGETILPSNISYDMAARAISADSNGNGKVVVSVAPQFTISADTNADSLMALVPGIVVAVKDAVIDALEEAGIDAQRGAYV